MKRFLLAAAALLVFSSLSFAQTGGVRAKILDEKGQPLEGVAVLMEFQGGMNLSFKATTGKKGDFMQIGLRPGMWKFTFTKEGFQPFSSPTRIALGEATQLPDTKLSPAKAGAAAGAAEGDELKASFSAAVAKIQAGDFDGAIVAFDAIIAKNPAVPEAYYNKGYAQVQKKDYAGAEPSLKKALEMKADYNEARLMLSNVYTNLGQKDKAIEVMSAGAGTDPKQLLALGETLVNNGDWPKATEAFLKLEAADPTNADVQYYLGTSALMNGKNAECATRLEKYLATNPTNEQKKATASGMLSACKK